MFLVASFNCELLIQSVYTLSYLQLDKSKTSRQETSCKMYNCKTVYAFICIIYITSNDTVNCCSKHHIPWISHMKRSKEERCQHKRIILSCLILHLSQIILDYQPDKAFLKETVNRIKPSGMIHEIPSKKWSLCHCRVKSLIHKSYSNK